MNPSAPPRARFTRLDVVMGRLDDQHRLYQADSRRHATTPLWLAADVLRELVAGGRLDPHPQHDEWARYQGRDVQPLAAI